MAATLKHIQPDAEKFMIHLARVSSSNPDNPDYEKLLTYCIKHGHWSVFEMVDVTMEIYTSRAISAQIIRHRSFHFQEFCIAGDTKITLEIPNGVKSGKRSMYTRTIEHLYNLHKKGKLPTYVRVFDENTRTFVCASIKEVFQTGVKPLYKLTLDNGKIIQTTKEHKFYTSSGFKSLEEAVGLSLVGNTATWTNLDTEFGCNGVIAYQDREWLSQAKHRSLDQKTGLQGIAEEAYVSPNTIRKWLRIHGLQYTKKEVASYTQSWNTGKRYTSRPRSMETIERMRKSAKKGADSNLWRGGVTRNERLAIADWCSSVRSELLKKYQYKCNKCGLHGKLELHHVIPVSEDKTLARDINNIEVLCFDCHRTHHKIAGHGKTWREKHKGNTLTVHWSKVKSIEYIGEYMTYDMEVDHVSHNYIANGIITHNSQRYANPSKIELDLPSMRRKGSTNRQGSVLFDDQETQYEMDNKALAPILVAIRAYDDLIKHGVALESARMVLPLCVGTRLYMKGTVRDWLHYCRVRMDEHTQQEHRDLATDCWNVLKEVLPVTTSAFEAHYMK
jgi:thymidylate synthase (FAD)